MVNLDKANTQRTILAIHLCAFAFIVMLQWLHFVWYFNQPVKLALVWSVVDWSVWFLLFSVFQMYSKEASTKTKIILASSFILFAGPVQIIISSGVYQILYTADKTLFESFIHLMNKRWFQNVLISSCAVLVYQLIDNKLLAPKRVQSTEDGKPSEINVFDGKSHHKLKSSDVYAACTTKNYVSLYTKDEEVVVRATLKEIREQLDELSFVQVSRSALVNTRAMSRLNKYSNSSFQVILANDMSIKVSRTYLNDVKACFS